MSDDDANLFISDSFSLGAPRAKQIDQQFYEEAQQQGGFPMLVLSRKEGETVVIGDGIRVTVFRIAGNRVTIGIQAPNDVRIVRAELELYPEDEAEVDAA